MKLPLILYERALPPPLPLQWKGMVGNVPSCTLRRPCSCLEKWEQHLLSVFLLKWIFLWLPMLSIPLTLNKGNFYETRAAYRLVLIHSTCSSNWQSELRVTHANIPTALPYFNNVIFRHHYVTQKNSCCIVTEQHCLCRVPHLNRQNLVLISPPKDYKATVYGTYGKYLADH